MQMLWLHTLRPLLADLALPPSPFLIALAASWPLIARRPRAGSAIAAAAAVCLWITSCLGAAGLASQMLLPQFPALSAQRMEALRTDSQLERRTAIIALGSGIQQYAPEYGGPKLTSESLERLRYAIWLGRELRLPVGFSGGLGWAAAPGQAEAAAAQDVATYEFKAPLRWAESRSRDTRENAAETIALLRADDIQRVIVVTSAVHMPRAIAAFEAAAAGTVIVFEAAPMNLAPSSRRALFDWVPSGEGITQFRAVMREWLWALGGA